MAPTIDHDHGLAVVGQVLPTHLTMKPTIQPMAVPIAIPTIYFFISTLVYLTVTYKPSGIPHPPMLAE